MTRSSGEIRPTPLSRRRFLGSAAALLALPKSQRAGPAVGWDPAQLTSEGESRDTAGLVGREAAPDDESYWGNVQSAFSLDRSAAYLNAAGVAPTSRTTMDSLLADTEFRNRLPARHLWAILEPRVERVRRQLADGLRCDPEELALTRGATEAIEIVQMGLELGEGDEVLTTDHDFFRMLNSWEQRERRDGISVRRLPIPTPPGNTEELVDVFGRAIGPRTKLIAFCHITNVNGQAYPVREICEMARDRGIKTLVDGAQAFGHVDVDLSALGCDFYGGSLHKYVMAPLGTGFLHVRREHIETLWPLNPSAHDRRADIRKFEDVGTHQAAPHNAVAEALRFRATVGQRAISARLRYLTERWVRSLSGVPGIRLYNRFEPAHTCGIATVGVDGLEPRHISEELRTRFGIICRPVTHPACQGVRASPHIYNTIEEIDLFVEGIATLNRERGI